jgi:PPOX class probable F420-dependent enzyme
VTADEARRRFAGARVARLATAGADAVPHLVPIVFAVAGDAVYSAVDAKPKRTTALRRLANVRANPRVALLADHYDDGDWTALWWVRADGAARVLAPADPEALRAVELLAARYAQYRTAPPSGPVLTVAVDRWSGWSASEG